MKGAEFVDPPPQRRNMKGSEFWCSVAEKARSRPGEWLRVPNTHIGAQVSAIKKGSLRAFRTGKWEATGRITENGRYTVYIRYLGEGDE